MKPILRNRVPMATALVALVLASMTGCKVQTATPVIPDFVPEHFSAGPVVGDPLPQQWWQSFGDSQLDALMAQALRDNFSVRSAWDRLSQAEQVAAKAGVRLLPTVTYSVGYSHTRQETGPRELNTDRYSAGLAASYELDLWGKIRSGREAALLDMQASEQAVASAAMTLSAGVVRTWYQLAEVRHLRRLLNEQLLINQKTLDIVSNQFSQGKVGVADVFSQKQLVETTQGLLIQAQQRDVLLQYQLALLAGLPPQPHWEGTVVELPETGVLPDMAVAGDILQNRPDVKGAWLGIQAADLRVSEAMLDRYPAVTLTASAQTNAERVTDLFDDWLATLATGIAGPLLDGGLRQAEMDRTRAVLSQRINDYRQTILTALKEVEDALVNESYQRDYLGSLSQQIKLAGDVVSSTRDKYLGGQLDYLRVLSAELSLQSLQRGEISARRQLVEYRVDLCRALASGWLPDRPQPAKLAANEKN